MTDLLPSLDAIHTALAWAFNNPATAVAVLVVGWKLNKKADRIERKYDALITEQRAHNTALLEAVEKVEHAATSVLGTHKLTRALIQKYRRDLGDVAVEGEAS